MSSRKSLLLVGVAGILLLILAMVSYRSREPVQPSSPKPGIPPSAGGPSTPGASPAPEPKKQAAASGKVLQADLLVRVRSSEGNPIAGAELTCIFVQRELDHPEGPTPDDKRSGIGKFIVPAMGSGLVSGSLITDDHGDAIIHLSLPRKDVYLHSYVNLEAFAEGYTDHESSYDLSLPAEGQRKEVTLVLEPGTVLSGRILGPEPAEFSKIWIGITEVTERNDPWKSVPKPDGSGHFQSTPAPRLPLHLKVLDLAGKYLTVDQELQPPFPKEIQVALQRDPDYVAKGTVKFVITNPPPSGKLDRKLLIYSETRHQQEGRKNTNYIETGAVEQPLKEGSYQVVLAALDSSPWWAHASFVVPMGGSVEVPLTLEKASKVGVKLRDVQTGKAPDHSNLEAELFCKISGEYVPVAYRSSGTLGEAFAGDMVVFPSCPAGELKIVVQDPGKKYGPWEQAFVAAGGESIQLTANLEKPR